MLPPFLGIRLLKASPLGRGGAVRRRRGAKPHSQHTCHPVGANCVRPREHQGAPLQIRALIFKNIKFYSFLRVAEGVDPYINEVCANIVLYSAEIPPFGAFLPCHPERSRNPNNVRIKRAVASLGSRQKSSTPLTLRSG